MRDRVTPLPDRGEPTTDLAGDEAWLSTLDDPHDTTTPSNTPAQLTEPAASQP